MNKIIFLSFALIGITFLSSCANWIKTAPRPELGDSSEVSQPTEQRSQESATSEDTERLSDKGLEKYAYELGLDPSSKPLTESERQDVLNRRKLRQLERGLDSPKERVNYSKVLPLFDNDQEKIDYLSIPSLEGRHAWAVRNKLWNRDKTNPDFHTVAEARDITLGMNQELVRKSWGEPAAIENSGNPLYKNERWKYLRDVPTLSGYKRERRYVYFEGGRVVGWETE